MASLSPRALAPVTRDGDAGQQRLILHQRQPPGSARRLERATVERAPGLLLEIPVKVESVDGADARGVLLERQRAALSFI